MYEHCVDKQDGYRPIMLLTLIYNYTYDTVRRTGNGASWSVVQHGKGEKQTEHKSNMERERNKQNTRGSHS